MASSNEKEIRKWRDQIDALDQELVKLLNRRTEYAIEIGKIKARDGIRIYDPLREGEVVRNVQSATSGPLDREAVQRLFERIIDETRRTEREVAEASPKVDRD
jgi:chorismate mutase-like protein